MCRAFVRASRSVLETWTNKRGEAIFDGFRRSFSACLPQRSGAVLSLLRLYKIRVGIEEQPPLPPQSCNRLIEQFEYYEYSLATSPAAFVRVAQTQMSRPEFNLYRCYIVSGFVARALSVVASNSTQSYTPVFHMSKTVALQLLDKSDNLPEKTRHALKKWLRLSRSMDSVCPLLAFMWTARPRLQHPSLPFCPETKTTHLLK